MTSPTIVDMAPLLTPCEVRIELETGFINRFGDRTVNTNNYLQNGNKQSLSKPESMVLSQSCLTYDVTRNGRDKYYYRWHHHEPETEFLKMMKQRICGMWQYRMTP